MGESRVDLVTGAFSFTGSYLARLLLERGIGVRTLTGHAERRAQFDARIEALPYAFDDHAALVRSLEGVHTFYNSFWVRFNHGERTYTWAVKSTKRLFRAAIDAGVERFVHVSIANPTLESPLAYYSGKAELERTLVSSGLSYAIIRPTLLFGPGGILINNIAWLLRHFPIFALMGDGKYRLQPVFVEDLARLMLAAGEEGPDLIWDAAGPETYAYRDLVEMIRVGIASRARLLSLPPAVAGWLAGVVGWFVRDVIITREEVEGLLGELLISHEPARCETSLREWIEKNRDQLGCRYLSELALHYR
jgi:NADH dehydrogenase